MDDDDNLPSMEALEISRNNNVHQSISNHFGGEEEEDIPDMAEYEEPNSLMEADPVSHYWLCLCHRFNTWNNTSYIRFLVFL